MRLVGYLPLLTYKVRLGECCFGHAESLSGDSAGKVEPDLITSTNALGEFLISTAPGAYTVRVSKLDYEETEVHDILVVKDEEVEVEVLLPPLV